MITNSTEKIPPRKKKKLLSEPVTKFFALMLMWARMNQLKFEVLMAANMKSVVLRHVTMFNLLDRY